MHGVVDKLRSRGQCLLSCETALTFAALGCQDCSIKLLLKSGAHVNTKWFWNESFLGNMIENNEHLEGKIFWNLKSAGERTSKTRAGVTLDEEISLKHTCRQTIRSHLIDVDRPTNLFDRIPRLGLPYMLVDYLLYNVSLD